MNYYLRDITLCSGCRDELLYEAIPVWERAYAVSEIKRCVEGAAGTRGADKVIRRGALAITLRVTPKTTKNLGRVRYA